MTKQLILREERPEDVQAVQAMVVQAFDKSPETATLVELMRVRNKLLLSYVAEQEGRIVGNIMFLPSALKSDGMEVEVATLAPMCVLPEFQRQGIGTRLTKEALRILHERGHPVVFVLGHPEFYPRFGFRPAGPVGIKSGDYDGPAFMVLELRQGALNGMTGELIYPPEFEEAGL